MRRAVPVLIALLVALGVQQTSEAQVPAFDPAPSTPGVHLVLFQGGVIDDAVESVADLASVWVTVEGELIGYIPGAPSFVNSRFMERFPGEIDAGTPMLVVIRPPSPPANPPAAPGGSAPTATPTPTSLGVPSGEVGVASLTSPVAPSADATLVVNAGAAASCTLAYTTPSGSRSEAEGLGTTAVVNGQATWTWNIGPRTAPGTGTLRVTCGEVSFTTSIVIA